MNCLPDMDAITLHASAVAVDGFGCLIVGRAESGKSTVALQMIAAGADLVSDDLTLVVRTGDVLIIGPPPESAGRVEIRGAGLIRLPTTQAQLALIIDLDRAEASRLPPPRFRHLLGVASPIILGRDRVGLAAIASLILKNGLEVAT